MLYPSKVLRHSVGREWEEFSIKVKKSLLKKKKKIKNENNKLKISFSLSYNVPIERNMLSNIEGKFIGKFFRFSNQKEMKRKKSI